MFYAVHESLKNYPKHMNNKKWVDFDLKIRDIFNCSGINVDVDSKKIPFATLQIFEPLTFRDLAKLTALCIEFDMNYVLHKDLKFTFYFNQDFLIMTLRERSGTMTGRMSNE